MIPDYGKRPPLAPPAPRRCAPAESVISGQKVAAVAHSIIARQVNRSARATFLQEWGFPGMRLRMLIYDLTTVLLIAYYTPLLVGSLVLKKLRAETRQD